uniref:Chitin-binding type-2 domain-containing protein n=1 Tax=Glossina brevipalpis TaxID=37001 RepID=A0A1A9W9Y8_9MUSC
MKTVWFLLYSLTLITYVYGDSKTERKGHAEGKQQQIEKPNQSTTACAQASPITTTTPKNPSTTTTCKPKLPESTTTPNTGGTHVPDTTTVESTTENTTTESTTITVTLSSQFYKRPSDCSTVNDGTILLDFRHCRRYYVCLLGRARRMRCPLGEWYDSDVGSCRDRRYVSSCAVSRN